MTMYLAASILIVQLASGPAMAAEAAVAATVPVKIPEDWTVTPPPSRKATDVIVRELMAEETKERTGITDRLIPTLRAGDHASLQARFEEAVVPGCLRPDGLKRQPTSIGPFGVSGFLALPLILVAKLRGKCK